MPEMYFAARWPDDGVIAYYSPSLIVRDYLEAGASYPLAEFVERSRTAMHIASDRVREKYGFPCVRAAHTLDSIETKAREFERDAAAVVRVETHSDLSDHLLGIAMQTSYPVIIVGGGQAGLSLSYCLKERGVDHIVFEKDRAASAWRSSRWDSFCLVTPNWQCQLPGFPYRGDDPNGFMRKDEIVQYIERYVAAFKPPLHEGVEVLRVARSTPQRGFTVTTSLGEFRADAVVVAVGGYHTVALPRMAERLPREIVQLHSSQYKNPQSLPPGDVLVVGTGQSGCQIAEDLHIAGRRVHLCVGSAPRVARRYRGKDVVEWLDALGYYDLPVHEHPLGEAIRARPNHYVTGRDGGHDIDLRRFALEGMQLYGRLRDIDGDRLAFAPDLAKNLDSADEVSENIKTTIDRHIAGQAIDAPSEARYVPVWQPESERTELDFRAAGISAVIWSTGFVSNFRWIELPAFDGKGYPTHRRGVTSVDGLYFLGLPWLYTWGFGPVQRSRA